MESVFERDVKSLATDDSGFWEAIDGKRVLVTGATGLIGGLAAQAILGRNRLFGTGTTVYICVRNVASAAPHTTDKDDVEIVEWDAATGAVPDIAELDYILHCAGNTNSALMVKKPIETIRGTVAGTESMLELAERTHARMVFVSSMEVYGAGGPKPLKEDATGSLDTMNVRSSYPAAKVLAETLCASYAAERDVYVSVARLAQTFGAGVAASDSHIYAEIARCCMAGTDITLATDGQKANMYCYTQDAVRALFILLAKGEKGEAYNVANEDTFCSILEMAQMAANRFSRTTAVLAAPPGTKAGKYATPGKIMLDTTKISNLGWWPRYDLGDMYHRMMSDWTAYV